MFVADVFTKLPKGNVRVSVSDSSMGPVVTEVKGLRGGSEWRANEMEGVPAYHVDGEIRVDCRRQIVRCARRLGYPTISLLISCHAETRRARHETLRRRPGGGDGDPARI